MGTLFFDLRDAARGLRRDAGFAATVILTLAVTIGATTAAFSIVNGILLKPLAFPEPSQLVTLREIWKEFSDRAPTFPVNQRHFEYWREHNQSFQAIAQYIVLPANLTSGGPAVQVSVATASGTLFDVLRVSAARGRTLAAADDREGAPAVAVLGDSIWRQRFGADPAMIGTAITLDGKPFTIVGVLPPTFRLPDGERLLADVDAVVPMRIEAGWVGDHNNRAIGRLESGVTLEQAQAELDVLQRQAGEVASAQSGHRVTLGGVVTPLADAIVGRSRRSVISLFAAILAVLAIACSNLTNLALTRALARARDAAVRSALGASRGRLVRRAVIDHALLALIGGAIGVWIAYAALQLFVQTAAGLPRLDEVTLDGRVLGFAALVTAATGVLVSILPVWHLGRRDPQTVLRSGGAAAGQGPAALRTRTALTAVQIAISVTLLTVTALLGASLLRVLDVDYGFSADHVLSVPLALPTARYDEGRLQVDAYDRVIAGVKALPGVRSVSSTSLLPMRGEGQVNLVLAAGTNVPQPERPSANFRFVGPEYFAALQLPVRRGRAFSLADRDSGRPMPSVVSESLAERLWPGQDAVGKEFGRGIEGEPGFEVVGVTADARTTSIERTPPLMVYVPYWWRPRPSISLLVKTQTDPLPLVPAIRQVVEQIDPEIAMGEARPLQQLVDATLAGRRYQAHLFVAFGVAALFIATLGVYAVTAYSLSKRRREMNIRVALGARTADVIGLLMKQAATAVVPGVGAGVLGALAAGGAIASLLYEVRPRDPLVLGMVAMTVGSVAIVASLLAARNGLSIDPAAALRDE
jgi:predicted permease